MPSRTTLPALCKTLRALCSELPDAEEYVVVHHPAFRVRKKPFAIAGLGSEGGGAALSINLGTEMQVNLLGDSRFWKTPYIGQHGWVSVAADDLPKPELATLVRESYLRVANAKQRAQLELGEEKGGPPAAGRRAAVKKKAAAPTRRKHK